MDRPFVIRICAAVLRLFWFCWVWFEFWFCVLSENNLIIVFMDSITSGTNQIN